jgi:THO complex subunit 2 N-terminus
VHTHSRILDIHASCSYKQNKFNLLREQSEGYTKLITELTNGMGPSHALNTGLPTEEPTAIDGRAQKVWNKIISLIGYFDLDPNRALDLILDVFSAHLTTHHAFFLALLSCSPWSTSRRRAILQHQQEMDLDSKPQSFVGKSFDEVLEMVQKVPSPPEEASADGSRVLAQVLGFKFTHYQARYPFLLASTLHKHLPSERLVGANTTKPSSHVRCSYSRGFHDLGGDLPTCEHLHLAANNSPDMLFSSGLPTPTWRQF